MTDGLLGLSMGVEPAEKGVMRRKPHAPDQSIWANGLGIQAVWSGLLIGIAALAVGYSYYEADSAKWQTMIFMTVGIMQVFQAIGTRSTFDSLRTIGLTTNRMLVVLASVVVALQLAAVYTPLNEFLDLKSLSVADLGLTFVLGIVFLGVLEVEKAVRRSRAES
jgi:Ca2+-transporting ATPase